MTSATPVRVGTLDVERGQVKQLAFGPGAHYCLGANLAKLGLAIALEALVDRFPRLALADGDVTWDYEGFAGIVHLPVSLAD